jgi:hypothetical protein
MAEVGMNDQLQAAMAGLAVALDAPRPPGAQMGVWRFTVRQRLGSVRDGLAAEHPQARAGWAVARERAVLRERQRLLTRLAMISPRILDAPEPEGIRTEIKRLLHDIDRHRQRMHDVTWDEAEVDFGGSE